jgi:hypothetical protein
MRRNSARLMAAALVAGLCINGIPVAPSALTRDDKPKPDRNTKPHQGEREKARRRRQMQRLAGKEAT